MIVNYTKQYREEREKYLVIFTFNAISSFCLFVVSATWRIRYLRHSTGKDTFPYDLPLTMGYEVTKLNFPN